MAETVDAAVPTNVAPLLVVMPDFVMKFSISCLATKPVSTMVSPGLKSFLTWLELFLKIKICFVIRIFKEYLLPAIASLHNMMRKIRHNQSCYTWHKLIPRLYIKTELSIVSPYFVALFRYIALRNLLHAILFSHFSCLFICFI